MAIFQELRCVMLATGAVVPCKGTPDAACWTSPCRYSRGVGLATSLICLVAATCFPGQAQNSDAIPRGALLSSQAIALNPGNGKVYAVTPTHGAVSIIDDRTHSLSSVKVGSGPVAVAVNTATNRVYVANHDSGTVSVLSGSTNATLATIKVGALPYALAVNEARNRIYVSNVFSNVLTIIDGATNTIRTLKTGSADAIAVDAQRDRTYLLSYEDSNLTVLDGPDESMSHVSVGKMHLWGLARSESANTLYVTRIGNADVVKLDEESGAMAVISTGNYPCAVAVNPTTGLVYVVNYGDGTVTVIDDRKKIAVATIRVGYHPQAIAIDIKSNLIYVANTGEDSVTVMDGLKNEFVTTLNAGNNPYALVVDSAEGQLYAANLGEPSFTKIDVRGLKRRPQ